MRARVAALLLLAVASTAAADDRVSAFVSDVGHGTGLAFAHAWSPRWSTELSWSDERRNARVTTFSTSAPPVTNVQKVHTNPMDLMMRFHFRNDTRWQPYVGAGVHYVAAPNGILKYPNSIFPLPVTAGHQYDNRTTAQIGGGVMFQVTPHVGLQFDLKQLLDAETVPFDSQTRGSFGVSWKF